MTTLAQLGGLAGLAALLTAIEHLDPVTWTAAERGVWDTAYHSYSLTVSVPARKDA